MDVHARSATSSSADRSWRRWHFGRSVLDERTHELLVDGVDAELERKPLEVLMYLVQHAGEVCTKDELLAGVWPGRILSDTVLTKCIGRLRDVLFDENQEIIKTSYGFGYRFVAPVRVETTAAPQPVRFDIRPEMHPPARPLWSLIERLGSGGHGEAWRARHDKTGEQRVFKFALEETALVALKREITLFRIINDTLGENARVVKLLDWNLEQLPYFVEAEFIAGGSLVDWVAVRGGVAGMSLSDRLEVVGKIADALGAVHSVGVLHKDLKPSNVLVKPLPGNTIDIVLADFGSGGVLDFNRLEALGITRLGFTRTIATPEMTSGTPLYLAPEILAGQPFTVKSDIYALGIILYQFIVGDFHKVMSPGWERGIDDELLREDIALMAEGNPAERLGDVEGLARRLRTLDERRRQLIAEREAQARAERARRLMERAQARRFGLILAFAALVVGLAVSTTLYFRAREAQEHTAVAAAQSKAVTEYLSKDVFSPVSSGTESIKNMSVIELLTRAGNEIDARFAGQPEIASELHFVIGRSFQTFYEAPLAVPHFKRALDLGQKLNGTGSESAMRSAAELIYLDYVLGNLPKTLSRYESTLRAGEARLDSHNISLLYLRQKLAWGHFKLGDWQQSADSLQAVIADTPGQLPGTLELLGRTELYLGQVLIALAKPAQAQMHLKAAISELSAALSEKHSDVSEARDALGRALTEGGRYAEAKLQLDEAEKLALQWAPPGTWTIARPRVYKALLLLDMDEPSEAEPVLADIIAYQDANAGTRPELDHTGTVRQSLGEVYLREGRIEKAVATLRKAVDVSSAADGSSHPATMSIRLSLAESLLADDHNAEAREVLERPSAIDLSGLPPIHPIAAQWDRVRGILALRSGDLSQARTFLSSARVTYEALYGPKQWRSVRARQELLSAKQ